MVFYARKLVFFARGLMGWVGVEDGKGILGSRFEGDWAM
jgi:hypothetical protein